MKTAQQILDELLAGNPPAQLPAKPGIASAQGLLNAGLARQAPLPTVAAPTVAMPTMPTAPTFTGVKPGIASAQSLLEAGLNRQAPLPTLTLPTVTMPTVAPLPTPAEQATKAKAANPGATSLTSLLDAAKARLGAMSTPTAASQLTALREKTPRVVPRRP